MPNPVLQRLLLCWLGTYLVVNVACHLSAGTNADSRLATMIAMVEDGSFRIDRYYKMTSDWARTPDGHYYSNKAPGPMFLGAVLYWPWDQVTTRTLSRDERDERRFANKAGALKFLSYTLQLLPFLCLLYFLAHWLFSNGISPAAVFVMLGCVLFGNTAALMMSTYYGHGMTALFFLAAIFFSLRGRHRLAGLSLGFCVLCDYGSALLLVPFLGWVCTKGRRAARECILGAILPAALWVWYHTSAFGSPFRIANQFQNPVYQDVLHEKNNLWGILLPFPSVKVLWELTFGASRGILWTQPWVLLLLILPAFVKTKGEPFRLYLMLLFSTLCLLWMNASFGGWHGGLPPGPRYLSVVFPAWGLWLGLIYSRMSLLGKRVTLGLVFFSAFFSCLVYATSLSASLTPLWKLYLERVFVSPSSSTIARLALLASLMGSLIFFTYRFCRSRVGSLT